MLRALLIKRCHLTHIGITIIKRRFLMTVLYLKTEILYIEIWQRLFPNTIESNFNFSKVRIIYSFSFPMGSTWSVCCESKVSFIFYLGHCSTESNIMTLSTVMYQEMFACIFSWTILSLIKRETGFFTGTWAIIWWLSRCHLSTVVKRPKWLLSVKSMVYILYSS